MVWHADAAYGAGVDEALDAGLLRGLEEVPRASNVGIVEFLGMARPQAVVSGDVEDQIAAVDGAVQGRSVTEVANYRFDVEFLQFTGGADEGSHAVSTTGQGLGHMPAKEA
jgi:hypothetical protein